MYLCICKIFLRSGEGLILFNLLIFIAFAICSIYVETSEISITEDDEQVVNSCVLYAGVTCYLLWSSEDHNVGKLLPAFFCVVCRRLLV